jgi:ribonuclease G
MEIVHDDGSGERRVGVFEGDVLVELHLHRSHGFMWGETGTAQIKSKSSSTHFLKTSDGRDILLRDQVREPVGASLAFRISREAIAEPGLLKMAEARRFAEGDAERSPDGLWSARFPKMRAGPAQISAMSDALSSALLGTAQAGDALISYQRTKAGLVFDIDGEGSPPAINLAAAREIARLLRLYQVGGMVMIDFVSVNSKEERLNIALAFDEASAADERRFERSAINGFGLMQVVRPRPRPSVLDILFGTHIQSVCDETQALWLLRAAATEPGIGARTITARPSVALWLSRASAKPLIEEVEKATGAPLSIIADPQLAGYGHVHASQA